MRLLAASSLSILCLIQYLSPQSARKLNRWLAVVKIFFLFLVLFAGFHAIRTTPYKGAGFQECAPPKRSKIEYGKAMLLVIFSYEGWENATFVAGEINPKNQRYLRKGFLLAVLTVGTLYLLVAAVAMYAIPFVPVAVNFSAILFGNNKKAIQVWAVFIATSSVGSLNSVIYTYSRIKQSLGSGNFLPWSDFWKSDSPELKNSENLDFDRAPKGGLWLHWIVTILFIGVSASLRSIGESTSMPGLLQTYAHCIILAAIGFLVLLLPKYAKERPRQIADDLVQAPREGSPLSWDFGLRKLHRKEFLRDKRWLRMILYGMLAILTIAYSCVNLVVIIFVAIPPYVVQDGLPPEGPWEASSNNRTLKCSSDDPKHDTEITFPFPVNVLVESAFPGKRLPAACFGVLGIGTCYYFLMFGSTKRFWSWSLAHCAGVNPSVEKELYYDYDEERIRRFGRRRTIRFESIQEPAEVGFFYWAFGGKNHLGRKKDRPPARVKEYLDNFLEEHIKGPFNNAVKWLGNVRRPKRRE